MKYVLKKLGVLLLTLLIVSMLAFLAFQVIPGDPTTKILGTEATEEAKAALRAELGLEGPVLTRYWNWLTAFLRGDLGVSAQSGEPVFKLYMEKFPYTLKLTIWGMVVTLVIAIPLGILAALKQNTWIDTTCTIIGLAGISLPCFASGILLILIFSHRLDLLPSFGAEHWYSYILPAITVGLSSAGLMLRTTRSSML